MNRSETVEAIANIERELQDQQISQDTLVVYARQLQGLVGYVQRYNLPSAKVNELCEAVERRLTPESLARALDGGVLPMPERSPNEGKPISVEDMPAELERVGELGFVPAGEADEPCEHTSKSFNDDGLPVCNDCGHIFQPPPTKPTIDRKTAIDHLFGKG